MEPKAVFATRAEELGNRVFDYFAMPAKSFYSRLLKPKAAVLVGGRGTGKTMLLKSMAFEYMVNNKSNEIARQLWERTSYLGCYIRADTNIVSSFRGRGIDEEEWGLLFAHYFNLRAAQQIVKTVKILINKDIISGNIIDHFINRYSEVVGESLSNNDINHVESSIKGRLDELVRYINNPKRFERPDLINNGTLLFEICMDLSENNRFSEKQWFILIDEYENLSELQQRIINTLIKANQPPVLFKIAMRPGGWWTQQTLSLSENLEGIADFDMINYHTDFSNEDYIDLIEKAFEKSLKLNGIHDPFFQNVKNLLPDLSPEDEALRIVKKTKKSLNYIEQIKDKIINYSENYKQKQTLMSRLIIDEDPLRTRFHLVLLDRGKKPVDIVNMMERRIKQYDELYRHNRIGTLFLFTNEYRQKKIYAGFETFVLLSSKIMRNFVSLFSRAWELSAEEGFSVEYPKEFTYEVQSKAAYDVSQGKVFEIVAYPSGPSLSSFANHLGRIFEQLNKDVRQSQPERNHFAIIGDISPEIKDLMRGALMYSILQEIPATKLRSETEIRGRDYIFNRIYCPYYQISYRKIHKLELSADEFDILIKGSDNDKKTITAKILKKYLKESDEVKYKDFEQLDIFDTLT